MSLIVSVVCVLLAYPIAYFLALGTSRWKYTLLLVIIVPFFTSFLLRVAAWKFILGDQGVINSFAYWTGFRADGDPIPQLLYSQFTVMLVLGYVWIPFVALPIFVSLENPRPATARGRERPRSDALAGIPTDHTCRCRLPGVIAAFVFIFIPTIGEYVTPSLVGGNRGFMFGNAIADLFGPGFDWTTGAVLSLFLFVVVLLLAVLFARFLSMRQALDRLMDVATSRSGLRALKVFFGLPRPLPLRAARRALRVLVQRRHDLALPARRLHDAWFEQFLSNDGARRGSVRTSAIIAGFSCGDRGRARDPGLARSRPAASSSGSPARPPFS